MWAGSSAPFTATTNASVPRPRPSAAAGPRSVRGARKAAGARMRPGGVLAPPLPARSPATAGFASLQDRLGHRLPADLPEPLEAPAAPVARRQPAGELLERDGAGGP